MGDWTTIRVSFVVRDQLNQTGAKSETHNTIVARLLNRPTDTKAANIILKMINLLRDHHDQFGAYCHEECPYPGLIKEAEALVQ